MVVRLRPATRSDAPDLARLVDMAGEGLPSYIWAGMAEPGEDVWVVGRRRAERDEGGFSWRNATMAEIEVPGTGRRVAGALVGYPLAEVPPPEDLPPMFQPMQQLESLAIGTWYVNVLAAYPEWRRQGVGAALMAEAERLAAGFAGMSLIVADANHAARRFYEALGYREKARRPMVKEGWRSDSSEWVLMLKPLPNPPASANGTRI